MHNFKILYTHRKILKIVSSKFNWVYILSFLCVTDLKTPLPNPCSPGRTGTPNYISRSLIKYYLHTVYRISKYMLK